MFNLFSRPKNWEQHFKKGMAHGSRGNFAKAEQAFRSAVALAPDEPYPHYELGYTLSMQGFYDKALEEFRTTNRIAPGFFLVQTEIYLMEAVGSGLISPEILLLLRSAQDAVDAYGGGTEDLVALSQNAVDAAPDCAVGHLLLGKALAFSDTARACNELERCLALIPDDTTAIDALTALGFLAEQEGDSEKALSYWKKASTEFKGNPHVAMCEALLAQREKQSSPTGNQDER